MLVLLHALTAVCQNNSQFLGKLIHVQKREIHKKPIRPSLTPPTGPRLGVSGTINQVPMDQVRRLAVPQSFPFSMEAVADLAARLSIQLAEQRDHNRRPSATSMFSNQSIISQVPYVVWIDSFLESRADTLLTCVVFCRTYGISAWKFSNYHPRHGFSSTLPARLCRF